MKIRPIYILLVLFAALLGFLTYVVITWMGSDIGTLVLRLESSDPMARIDAARQLGRSASPRAYDPLIRALDDKDPRVSVAVAEALAQLGDTRAIRAVGRAYKRAINTQYADRHRAAYHRLLEIAGLR